MSIFLAPWSPAKNTTKQQFTTNKKHNHHHHRPQGYAVRAYESQLQLHGAFNQLFGSSPGNWLVPSLHAVCKSTHRLAKAADQEGGRSTADHAKLQSAVTLLQESFSRTFNDRKEYNAQAPLNGSDGSKKAGVLGVVNELFLIYFFLNTLRLCKNLVRPMEARKLVDQGGATMGELVTYRYFTGRLALFEDQYADAERNLEFAFANCHQQALRNKRLILRYLIPVKLYRGRLPSTACKFQMPSRAEGAANIHCYKMVEKGKFVLYRHWKINHT